MPDRRPAEVVSPSDQQFRSRAARVADRAPAARSPGRLDPRRRRDAARVAANAARRALGRHPLARASTAGRARRSTQVAIYNEELARAGAPPLLGRAGLTLVGPTLMAHGTEEQRARWMPRILGGRRRLVPAVQRARVPAATSRASTTRAEERWRVPRDRARRCGRRTRRSPTWASRSCAPTPTRAPHQGISMLAIPMDAKGVDVRPLRQMTGEYEFNEVFLDDVEVPVENLIGPENEGWRVANTTLGNERGALVRLEGAGAARGRARSADRRRAAASGVTRDPLRAPATRAVVDRRRDLPAPQRAHARPHRAGRGDRRRVEHREVVLGRARASGSTTPRPTCSGPAALLTADDPGAVDGGRWGYGLLTTRANSIMGGSSEIQRNILGERVLGSAPGAEMTDADDAARLRRPARPRRPGAVRARGGYPHDVWTRLRAEAPVARIEAPGFKPFWAITRHADIMEVVAPAAGVLERVRHHAHAGRAAGDEDAGHGRDARPAEARTDAPGRERAVHAQGRAGHATTTSSA